MPKKRNIKCNLKCQKWHRMRRVCKKEKNKFHITEYSKPGIKRLTMTLLSLETKRFLKIRICSFSQWHRVEWIMALVLTRPIH
jgi:hypothetical protein